MSDSQEQIFFDFHLTGEETETVKQLMQEYIDDRKSRIDGTLPPRLSYPLDEEGKAEFQILIGWFEEIQETILEGLEGTHFYFQLVPFQSQKFEEFLWEGVVRALREMTKLYTQNFPAEVIDTEITRLEKRIALIKGIQKKITAGRG